MENVLLTKVTKYGLSLLAEQIKNNVQTYLIIGSPNSNDQALLARLEQNDLNNDLTYTEILNNRWNGFEGTIHASYYDINNFLTFDIKLPAEKTFNVYVYALALLDVDAGIRKVVSITRSPAIFNKTKHTSSLFSIKMTFSQEAVTDQYRSNLFTSQFLERKYLFNGSVANGSNILESDVNLSGYGVGTVLYSENLPENCTVIGNSYTDNTLNEKQLKLSVSTKKQITNESIFVENMIYRQDDYVTKPEFSKAINDHNHNDKYYLVDQTVRNSNMLDGKTSGYFASMSDIERLNFELYKKLDLVGGVINGPVRILRNRDVQYLEDEICPIYKIKDLINELKIYVDDEHTRFILNQIDGLEQKQTNELNKVIDIEDKRFAVTDEFIKDQKALNNNITQTLSNTVSSRSPIFFETPIIDKVQELARLNDNSVLRYSSIKEEISKNVKTIEIDLRALPVGEVFPVAFNYDMLAEYTDSVIWNEEKSGIDCMFKLCIFGAGSATGRMAQGLEVKHFKTGSQNMIQKVFVPVTSSAVVVFLRGGIRYYARMNGPDSSPFVLKTGTYALPNSSYILEKGVWDDNKFIRPGSWMYMSFNQRSDILIDYTKNPHLIFN